jgi:5-methylcytosine-specific restriction endonuclease McrA
VATWRPMDWREQRDRLWEQQRGCCFWCGLRMSFKSKRPAGQPGRGYPTFDHLHEVAAGGRWEDGNIVLAHRRCNEKRGRDFQNESEST